MSETLNANGVKPIFPVVITKHYTPATLPKMCWLCLEETEDNHHVNEASKNNISCDALHNNGWLSDNTPGHPHPPPPKQNSNRNRARIFWFHSSLFLKKKNKNVRKLWPPAVSSMSQTTRYKSNNNNSTSIQASREEARPQFVFFAFTAVRSLSLCLLPFSVGGVMKEARKNKKKKVEEARAIYFCFSLFFQYEAPTTSYGV